MIGSHKYVGHDTKEAVWQKSVKRNVGLELSIMSVVVIVSGMQL